MACGLAQSYLDVAGILTVYLAACINQFILVKFVRDVFADSTDEQRKKTDKLDIVGLFIFKIFILVAGISLGVLFMGDRVIIPVINYVIQMFILVYSLK